jgi:hypothetical protein
MARTNVFQSSKATGMCAYKILFYGTDSGHASTQQTPSLSFFLIYLLQLQLDDQS